MDGEASSPARCRGSNLRFEPSAVSPRAKPENPKGFQPPCHPLQSPLKIEDFSGAEPARKRFFLWELGFTKTALCPRCAFALPKSTMSTVNPRRISWIRRPWPLQFMAANGRRENRRKQVEPGTARSRGLRPSRALQGLGKSENRQRRRAAGFVYELSVCDQTSASESFSRGASSTERMAQRAMTSWVLAAPTAMVTVSSLSATTVP